MKNQPNKPGPERYLLLLSAVLALLAGLWTGLSRLGWSLPLFGRPELVLQHGPLMIAGFLGVLIPIERAVAVEHRAAYMIPFLSALGMVLLLVPELSPGWGRGMITFASIGYLGLFLYFLSLDPQLHTFVMVGGAVLWVLGNALWALGWGIPYMVFYWMGFLILTIAGERLELARTLKLEQWHKWTFAGIGLLLSSGLILMSIMPVTAGARYSLATGLILLGIWLLIAGPSRKTIRIPGRLRFIAANLMIGYVWLIVAGIVFVVFPWEPAGPVYDAMLHTVFLGFVFSMIFAHAPIIFPAITGKPMTFLRIFYLHTILLHGTLTLRVVGDLGGPYILRSWGGLLNGIAILLFIASSAGGVLWDDS